MTVTPSILRYRVYTRSWSGPGSTSTVDWTFRPGTPSWPTSMDWNKRVRLRVKRWQNCWNLFHVLDKSYLLAYETDSIWFLVAPGVTLVVAWESLRGGCAKGNKNIYTLALFCFQMFVFCELFHAVTSSLVLAHLQPLVVLHSWALEGESIHGHVRKHEKLFATGHQSVDGQVRECESVCDWVKEHPQLAEDSHPRMIPYTTGYKIVCS